MQDNIFRAVFEQEVEQRAFSMSRLMTQLIGTEGRFAQTYRNIAAQLNPKTATHAFQGIIRAIFLIEAVRLPAGSTKMTVRWAERLDAHDPRYASFTQCLEIFEQVASSLLEALSEQANLELLQLFALHKQVSYEVPLDYQVRDFDTIHRAGNLVWYWDELPRKTVAQRALLYDRQLHQYSRVFGAAYGKIRVKTYLTDRSQTGLHQTNREKRWEAHPGSYQFALRRDCWSVEHALVNQLCHMEDFPADLHLILEREGVLTALPIPYRCPITMDVLSFKDFQAEVADPVHGRASFQVGHLNPLKLDTTGAPLSGHTGDNIGWVTFDGNRIQGSLSLDDTRKLIYRILENYEQAGLTNS